MAIISKTLLGPYLLFALPVVMSRHRRCGTKISPKAACSPRGLFLSVWHVLQSVQGEGWDTMFPPGTFKNCILQDPSSICILVGCRLHFIPCQAPCGASSAGLEPGKLQLFHHLPHRSRHFLPLNPTPHPPNLHIGPQGGRYFTCFLGGGEPWLRAIRVSAEGRMACGLAERALCAHSLCLGLGPAPACLEKRGLGCSAFIRMLLRSEEALRHSGRLGGTRPGGARWWTRAP